MGPSETAPFCRALVDRLAGIRDVTIIVCPPFVSLSEAARTLEGSSISVYAQNAHWQESGPFTGEVSPSMLREAGAAGTIVGHSERREYFGDTDETVARRAVHALEEGLEVIACVGERESERDGGRTEQVLERQVSALRDAAGPNARLTLAYEPVWAIGTGRTATAEQVQEAHEFIRSLLDLPILYGGSVKPENAGELLARPDVDGALVGGASLDVASFTAICEAARG